MSSPCKGLCTQFAIAKVIRKTAYSDGLKLCTECNVWMRINSAKCPCCVNSVRTKPRHNRKKKLEYIFNQVEGDVILPL